MNPSTSSLFSQLLCFIDRSRFAKQVKGAGSERRTKGFASWDHFVAMLFCQFAQARSLREIAAGLCLGSVPEFKHRLMDGWPPRRGKMSDPGHRHGVGGSPGSHLALTPGGIKN